MPICKMVLPIAGAAAVHFLTYGAVAQPAELGAFTVTQVSAMVKLRQTDKATASEAGRNADGIQLWAARGEAESTQLAIHAQQPLNDVRVTSAALSGPEGASLRPEVSLVGYVPVKQVLPYAYAEPGDLPDPLLSVAPFSVNAGMTRALWITVQVPVDALAGAYAGTVSLEPRGLPKRDVPLAVTVADVTIPARSALHTSVASWNGGASKLAYGDLWNAERQAAFREQMLDYRLTSPPPLPWDTVFSKQDGKWQADWTQFDPAIEAELAKGATTFRFPVTFRADDRERPDVLPWIGKNPVPADVLLGNAALREDRSAILRLTGEHFTEKNWDQYLQIKIFDEPSVTPASRAKEGDPGPQNIENIKAIATYIHNAHPNLRLNFTTTTPYYETVALDFPAYIWVPHINQFHPGFQLKRQAMGEPNWMYECVTTKWVPKFPDNWRIDRQGTSHRAIGWWLFRYGCDGYLYWCVDRWSVTNVWEEPAIFKQWPDAAGEGFLFYPNPDKAAPPLPSIRVELLRDGFEDYDLLILLREGLSRLEADPQADAQLLERTRKLLDVEEVIPGKADFCEDPTTYETRHREMLNVLSVIHGGA
ncbi:MAG: DUF4091 domain-containing protein [Armatimonadetes bacterium]|nr:DUF4091 domain-containing protein [Armatimonadota bacterium]MDI9586169.1 DUF6067 family protein [Acidobacteriota bacterium]